MSVSTTALSRFLLGRLEEAEDMAVVVGLYALWGAPLRGAGRSSGESSLCNATTMIRQSQTFAY